jgi:hypothetical protein
VGQGDLFLFWGLFREFDEGSGWIGERHHSIWGWLQVGDVVPVDDTLRPAIAGEKWRWAADHPHSCFGRDPSNPLYVASEKLSLAGGLGRDLPGAGAFDFDAVKRRLTLAGSKTPRTWSLPGWFLPGRRPPLTYHRNRNVWSARGDGVQLTAASRGQEFVLDADHYPEAISWAASLLTASA